MINYTIDDVTLAYRKLKRSVYYDKSDLALRQRLSSFEVSPDIEKEFNDILEVINIEKPNEHPEFKKWLDQIEYRIVCKKLKEPEQSHLSNGTYITNVTSAQFFEVGTVNYFIDAPIPLQLIAVIWIMKEGRFLDAQLGQESYGARLESGFGKAEDSSSGMFFRYHERYKKWRDSGIQKAKQILSEDKQSVCILGLDIQEYYYHINLDFDEITNVIQDGLKLENDSNDEDEIENENESNRTLLECIREIASTYRKKITPSLSSTHKYGASLPIGLPIGLISSPLLANWHLRKLDESIKSDLRPAYYGRYVDDIFIVFSAPSDIKKKQNPIEDIIDSLFVKTGILLAKENNRYEIANTPGLFLQQDKCILQHFDVSHSIAGLDKFQKKLEENGSDFLLLPVDEGENSLEDVAYELLYDGSVNKFRSVKGVAENRYELAKYLARQTMLHLVTLDAKDLDISLGLRNFFKGKNAIMFSDLWERVFTFFIIAGDKKGFFAFEKRLNAEIKRITYSKDDSIAKKLIFDLQTHLKQSEAMAIGLAISISDFDEENIIDSLAMKFLKANLIRHHFIRIPLLNFTTFDGPLISRTVKRKVHVDNEKIKNSPRFVNFDECLLLVTNGTLEVENTQDETRRNEFERAKKIYFEINCRGISDIEWSTISKNDGEKK